MSADPPPGLTSIIVPCFNQWSSPELCLQALFRHTRRPWELIVVDNGSTDETAAYLAGVQDATPCRSPSITNAQNVGFPAAINQGLQAARGEYLVLLNNDAVVTDGWLDQLIALTQVRPDSADRETSVPSRAGSGATRIPPEGGTPARNGESAGRSPGLSRPTDREPTPSTIGLVGPMSNYVSSAATGRACAVSRPRRDARVRPALARRAPGPMVHRAQALGVLPPDDPGRVRAVGGLDERFGLGLFDDDDLAERARRAGFELAVAHDLFVHHFGSRTFAGNGIDAEALLRRERAAVRREVGAGHAPRPAGRTSALGR